MSEQAECRAAAAEAAAVFMKLFAGLGVLVALAGAVLFIVSVWSCLGTMMFLRRAAKAEGEVVRLVQPESSMRGGNPAEFVIYSFTDAEGREHERSSSSNLVRGDVGDRVAVLYDPESPGTARLDDFSDLWTTDLILLAAGAVMLLGGAGMVLIARSQRRNFLAVRLEQ